MVKKLIVSGAMALFLASPAVFAADPSENGGTTSPLKIYTGGISVGAIKSINDPLKADQSVFLKLTFQNNFYFSDNVSMFLDADWFAPGSNFGADLGFDYYLLPGRVRPFVGGGVGAHYFDKAHSKFGDNFGPSGTVHLGFVIDVTDQVEIRVRAPFHVVGNAAMDNGAGVDIGMMFGSRFRNVKKLNYN